MNKKSTFIITTFCLLGFFSMSAQKHTVRNFLSVNGNSAYAGQIRTESRYDFNSFLGGIDNVGIGYQLYANHFTLSLGVETGVTILTNYSNEDITLYHKTVPQGTLELLGNIHVNMPVMFGGEWGKFYFKTGLVPSLNLVNGGTVLGPVLNPDNPEAFKTTKKVRFKNPFQLFGRFEIGGSIGKFTPFEDFIQPKARFYLGGYVDYGFTYDSPKEPRGHYIHQIPYAVSREGYKEKVTQISVGLRFTCLLNCAK